MMLSVASFGQKDDFHKRIKALKVSFITEQLQLAPKEAEVFWPIYNAYDEKMDDLRHEERDLWRKLYKEKGVKADLIENFSVKRERIKTIYNPYNMANISAMAQQPVDDLPSKPYIIGTGRLMLSLEPLSFAIHA